VRLEPTSFAEEVTFQRAALLLGLQTPEETSAWADAALAAHPDAPAALIEATLAPRELTALRAALAPAALASEPPRVVHRLVAAVAADVRDGRRTIDDTMHVLTQLRRLVRVPRDLSDTLGDLAGAWMLATAGVRGDLAAERARVAAWLSRFEP